MKLSNIFVRPKWVRSDLYPTGQFTVYSDKIKTLIEIKGYYILVWTLIDGQRTVAEIVEEAKSKMSSKKVVSFLTKLEKHHFIEILNPKHKPIWGTRPDGKFKTKAKEIISATKSEINEDDIHNLDGSIALGSSGTSLFYFYCYLFSGRSRDLKNSEKYFRHFLSCLGNETPALHLFGSLCGGIWMANKAGRLTEAKSYALILKKAFWSQLEKLHLLEASYGLAGYGQALISMGRKENRKAINAIVSVIKKRQSKFGPYKTWIANSVDPSQSINLGVAHGVSGILLFL